MNNDDIFLVDIVKALSRHRDVDSNILDDISIVDTKSFMFTISRIKLRWYCKSEYYLPQYSSHVIGKNVTKKIEKSIFENSLVGLTIEEPIFEQNVEYVKYADEATGVFEDRLLLQYEFKSLKNWLNYGEINASFFKEDFVLMSEIASEDKYNNDLSDEEEEKIRNIFLERLEKYVQSKIYKPDGYKGLNLDIKYSNGKVGELYYLFNLITFSSHGNQYRALIYPLLNRNTEECLEKILFESYPKDEETALASSKNSSAIFVSILGILGILVLYYFARHFSVLALLSLPIFYFWKFSSKDNKLLDKNSNIYKQKLTEFLKKHQN